MAQLPQPFCYRRRSKNRHIAAKLFERLEGQVIRVSVCHEDRIDTGKFFERNSRLTYTSQQFPERWLEIRISEESLSAKLN
jgi:hypothetical protein